MLPTDQHGDILSTGQMDALDWVVCPALSVVYQLPTSARVFSRMAGEAGEGESELALKDWISSQVSYHITSLVTHRPFLAV